LVPLATIAADVKAGNNTVCKIFVQELYVENNLVEFDYSIILGSMFFQQISIFTHKISEGDSYWELYVNPNALEETYLGSVTRLEGPNPFFVEV